MKEGEGRQEGEVLYSPPEARIQKATITQFQKFYQERCGQTFASYSDWHAHTVQEAPFFWRQLVEFFSPTFEGKLDPVCTSRDFLQYGWFPEVKLNFAENLLEGHGKIKKLPDQVALSCFMENGTSRFVTYGELKIQVKKLAGHWQRKIGLKAGEVVAAFMPNIAETTISMLAATHLGAVFTSTSSDFGAAGVIDRFGQVRPKILVTTLQYQYGGKTFSQIEKLKSILQQLDSIEEVLIIDAETSELTDALPAKTIFWRDILALEEDKSVPYVRRNFSDPLYIMYSSGTTGKPKCIIHSLGGTLLQHIKELGLHSDITEEKKIFFFTTCGWMMWNWLMSSLYFGANLYLYEGSPSYPSFARFVGWIDSEKIQIWGTSPKFLKALEAAGRRIAGVFPLANLETILSTGAPLLPEQYDFVYQKLKKDLLLVSMSGGTDILSCFMLGNPTLPVYRGEIQCLGLGMDVACVNEKGQRLIGEEGELVCGQNFVSTPLGFWQDEKKERFSAAYFERFKGMWHHGDFIRISLQGTVRVFGRSDATLNPGGVRIGTAEIYRQVESLSYIGDSLCVGYVVKGEERVLLFVKLDPVEDSLTQERKLEIKQVISSGTTPRHVPWGIYKVKDIPYTRSGKKMELLIQRLLAGKKMDNLEAMQNPECIQEYLQLEIV